MANFILGFTIETINFKELTGLLLVMGKFCCAVRFHKINSHACSFICVKGGWVRRMEENLVKRSTKCPNNPHAAFYRTYIIVIFFVVQ